MKNKTGYIVFKRLFDLFFSIVAIIVLTIPLIIISVAIKIESKGPILFTQKRVGKNKKFFKIYKFRSMTIDTDPNAPTHLLSNASSHITKVGRFIRNTSLDELPQLFNILIGNMSFVGPRPALWNQDDLVAERDKYHANDVLPGLTGLAQVSGRDAIEIADKARVDGEYVRKRSFIYDLYVIYLTIRVVLKRVGLVEGGTGSSEKKKNSSATYQYIQNRIKTYRDEKEFYQTLTSFFGSIDKESLNSVSIDRISKLFSPNNILTFDVDWVDDKGAKHTNAGYRIQYNNSNGFYKGGLRFHPNVNVSVFKMLGFEQTFKNAITGFPMGGAKGGSNFNPKGKSKSEIERFCKAFIEKLSPYIGEDIDVPAGDIGVSSNEIGIMYRHYQEFTGKIDCSLTGKPLELGGTLCRKEATGFGLCYITNEMLTKFKNDSLKGKRVVISGSGNVALYAAKKAVELGATVVAMSDSDNAIFIDDGLNIDDLISLKETEHKRIRDYALDHKNVHVISSPDIWSIPCDVALTCATQFELNLKQAKKLHKNHVFAVCEGSNMGLTDKAKKYLIKKNVLYLPGKAANAGGVAVSYLEIVQNKNKEHWTFERVDNELKGIMSNIFNSAITYLPKDSKNINLLSAINTYALFKVINSKND